MKRALVLVEGQTEERFVKEVLQPHLWQFRLDLTPTLLVTKVVKNGPLTAARIGLDAMRADCPHFNDWVLALENYARS